MENPDAAHGKKIGNIKKVNLGVNPNPMTANSTAKGKKTENKKETYINLFVRCLDFVNLYNSKKANGIVIPN
ncbi:uncharacterized protein METZ01_LOCUS516588, partial [marine metagenome]